MIWSTGSWNIIAPANWRNGITSGASVLSGSYFRQSVKSEWRSPDRRCLMDTLNNITIPWWCLNGSHCGFAGGQVVLLCNFACWVHRWYSGQALEPNVPGGDSHTFSQTAGLERAKTDVWSDANMKDKSHYIKFSKDFWFCITMDDHCVWRREQVWPMLWRDTSMLVLASCCGEP